jgi:hypothetical protein
MRGLPIVDDPKLANDRGFRAEMPESEASVDAVPMQRQEGPTGEETPRRPDPDPDRRALRVVLSSFAQLKPVRLEKPPGRDSVEVAAGQRERTDGPWDPFDDVEEDLEWEVAEFGHGQLQVERGSEWICDDKIGGRLGKQFKAPSSKGTNQTEHRVSRDD